ncbi:transketolase [Microbaculum marinisediminis]|uniref:Transketolase n=1 Tax=Microbaculum marinisediminis TaxID=2931392 RepID=A0AAW5R331_9HYPH|nr:transketolase [Microbaculum sp. A6E488]MCT8973081.1 transketolase [Microbaculum sp. A6E488]
MSSRALKNVTREDLKDKARLIRRETVRLTDICGSGHYGSSFSMAELVAALYYQFMHVRPDDPKWDDRDRFLLGKGHAAIGLYPVLADLGFFPQSWLDSYTRLHSPLGDHPDVKKVPGADFSSGSIGHNLSVSVGMALGLQRKGSPGRVICMMGDGEQTEGQIWEAAISGAHWDLSNLIGIVDINGAGSDGDPQATMATEPLVDKWRAFGWDVIVLEDGHDLEQVQDALNRALNGPGDKPRCVLAYTVAGKGVSFMEGTWQWHLGFLGPKDLERAYAEIEAGDIG